MKKILAKMKILVLLAIVVTMSVSCKKDTTEYKVRVQNDMYMEFLGFPFMKYDIVELKIGGNTISEVPYSAYNAYSEYVTVESGKDYNISIKVDEYLYNTETFVWEFERTHTYDLGTESWNDDEDYKTFKMKFKIGDLLQAYSPIFTTYGEE